MIRVIKNAKSGDQTALFAKELSSLAAGFTWKVRRTQRQFCKEWIAVGGSGDYKLVVTRFEHEDGEVVYTVAHDIAGVRYGAKSGRSLKRLFSRLRDDYAKRSAALEKTAAVLMGVVQRMQAGQDTE